MTPRQMVPKVTSQSNAYDIVRADSGKPEKLGQGWAADVYKAVRKSDRLEVALKICGGGGYFVCFLILPSVTASTEGKSTFAKSVEEMGMKMLPLIPTLGFAIMVNTRGSAKSVRLRGMSLTFTFTLPLCRTPELKVDPEPTASQPKRRVRAVIPRKRKTPEIDVEGDQEYEYLTVFVTII